MTGSRFLTRQLSLDVVSLQGQGLGQLPDQEVIRMARSLGRVIVTLDRDFAEYFHRTQRLDIGIIYLDLPNPLSTIPQINRLLAAFFRQFPKTSTCTMSWSSSRSTRFVSFAAGGACGVVAACRTSLKRTRGGRRLTEPSSLAPLRLDPDNSHSQALCCGQSSVRPLVIGVVSAKGGTSFLRHDG